MTVTSQPAGYKLAFAASLSEQTSCPDGLTLPPSQKCVIAKVDFANVLDRAETVDVDLTGHPSQFGSINFVFPARDVTTSMSGATTYSDDVEWPRNISHADAYGGDVACPDLNSGIGSCTGDDMILQPSARDSVYVELGAVPANTPLSDFQVYTGTQDDVAASGDAESAPVVTIPLTN